MAKRKAYITSNEYSLWCTFHQAYDLVSWHEDDVFAKANITYQQFLVLWAIKYHDEFIGGPIIINDLVPLLYRSSNSISQIVNRMEKNGLLKKLRDLSDGRAVRLIMTDKGKKMFIKTVKPNFKLIKGLLSTFSEKEIETLLLLVEKLKKRTKMKLRLEQIKYNQDMSDIQRMSLFLDKLYHDLAP